MKSCSPSFGLERIGGEFKYLFKSWRAFSQAGVHSKSLDLCRVLKKRLHFSEEREMKQESASIRPAKPCTS